MKARNHALFALITFGVFMLADYSPHSPAGLVFVGQVQAVVGRPLTPMSGAGVARRTTRRVVVASDAAASSSAQQQQQQAAAAPQAAPASAAVPSGTVVTALPAGCESVVIDGASVFNCSGTYYKPGFQSNNLVYVVQ